MRLKSLVPLVASLVLLTGCASYGVVENVAVQSGGDTSQQYSLEDVKRDGGRSQKISLLLAFSGGGTRAAAMAYGVLLELRDTNFPASKGSGRFLDEVDAISSVSGGSFTSAYYGLHGDGIFDDYEEVFLRQNIQGSLIKGLFRPSFWFGSTGRTEQAVNLYEDKVFKNATFADMKKVDGPLIMINASDLGYGARFTFIQEYFDLLCSDISSYPIARAVTASSAVPVLFNPVVVKNYDDCKGKLPLWLSETGARAREGNDLVLDQLVDDLESFHRQEGREYIHFVDGGITDNLGLRAIIEIIELLGGPIAGLKRMNSKIPKRIVVVSVDAATNPPSEMDVSTKQPSTGEVLGAMSNIQLHRYNTDTLALMDKSLERWTSEASTPEHTVIPYFIRLGFPDLKDEKRLAIINAVPTSFSLTDEQVDVLIQAGRDLLRMNPEFQRLLTDINES